MNAVYSQFEYHKDIKKEIEICEKFNPDIVFYFPSAKIWNDLLFELRDKLPDAIFVLSLGDVREDWSYLEKYTEITDLLLTTFSDPVDWFNLKEMGFKYIDELHQTERVDPTEFAIYPRYDCSFAGYDYKNTFPNSQIRRDLLQIVDINFNLITYGNYDTKNKFEWFTGELLMPLALSDGKITLGMNHIDTENYYTKRFWHSLCTGRLHLTYYIPNMERDFKNHVHLVWFKSIDEAIEQIKYYLDKPLEREAIGERGRKLFLKNHSWKMRAKQFKKIMERYNAAVS